MSVFNKIYLSDGTTVLPYVKSVTFNEAVNANDDLAPGCVSSSSIVVEVYGAAATAVQGGDTVYYYQVDETDTENLIGVFTCEPVIRSKNRYRFVAHDNARKLDADFSAWLADHQSNFPMSVYMLTVAACTVAGVTLQNASFPNSSQQVNAFYANGLTCRDIVSYAAEIAGQFAKCDANGELSFSWYNSFPGYRIYPSSEQSGAEIRVAYKQDGLNYSNYTVPAVDHVAVHPSGVDDAAYIYPTTGTSDVVLHVRNNLLLTSADASFYNAVAQRVYTAMSAVGAYRSFSANMFPKESPFRAGDIVAVTDIQGVSFTAPVMSLMTTNAVATLSATGNEVRENKTNTDKAIVQLNADVVRINKLKVDWADIDQAIINTVEANELKSSDFVPANDGIFAENGMEIDLANKTIKATDFAVTKNGKLYAKDADLSGVTFSTAEVTTSNLVSLSSVEGAYTMMANAIGYRTIKTVGISGITRDTVDAKFEYYEGATLVGITEMSNMPRASFYIPLGADNADKVRIGLKLQSGESNIRLGFVIVSGTTTFVTYPAGANVTYTDGISVDGVTVDSAKFSGYDSKLSDLGNGNVKFKRFTINANATYNLAVAALEHGILFITSRATGACGQYLIFCGSNNTIYTTTVKAGSSLTLTGSTNQLAIANGSTSYAAYGLYVTY